MTKKNCLLALLLLSALTRLPGLKVPNEVVFDEVHYGKFVNAYTTTGEYFFDVHPPWGKLIPAALLKLSGYKGGQSFERIGLPYDQASSLAVRLYPAIVGVFCPLLAFLILLDFGVSLSIAFFVGLVYTFDNGLIIQSRLLLLYGPLLFWQLMTIWSALRAFQSPFKWNWALGAGLSAGMSMGTQFPGMTAPAILGLFGLIQLVKEKEERKPVLGQLAIYASSLFVIYVLGFIIHFELLPGPGPGDAFKVRTGHFWTDFWSLHQVMYSASATLYSIHQDMSPWYTWPIMKKAIYYWQGRGCSMYFLSNSIVWILGTALGLYAIFRYPKKKKGFSLRPQRITLCLFLLSVLPLCLMSRVMFLYHYLIPILFLWLYIGVWLNRKKLLLEFSNAYWGFVGLLILGYFWMAPLTYGWLMPAWYWASIPWQVYH